jgi:hypothetical protein
MFPDTGGYSRANVHDLHNSQLLILSALDANLLDYNRREITELERNVTPLAADTRRV